MPRVKIYVIIFLVIVDFKIVNCVIANLKMNEIANVKPTAHHFLNMQIKMHIFLRISLLIQYNSARGHDKHVLTFKELFFTVITNLALSYPQFIHGRIVGY